MRIALLEDDLDHADTTARALHTAGHSCEVFTRGEAFLRATLHDTFDVLILDWGLPDMTGVQVLDTIRQRQEAVPVLFLTSRDAEQDVVEALSHGADDYLAKPPRPAELLARLVALKRRADSAGAMPKPLSIPPFVLDPVSSSVKLNGEPVELTLRQFQLALVLARVATWPQPRLSASESLKRQRRQVLRKLHLTVRALPIMDASRRWLMPRVKLACSSNRDRNQKWQKFKQRCRARVRAMALTTRT